mmetsp:Transcript_10510/g.42428  ORF Transcript_10510/g.42428 Transcript_10510/m.42428 type:complete len:223 (+) Transcript_10510:3810-4478(+)
MSSTNSSHRSAAIISSHSATFFLPHLGTSFWSFSTRRETSVVSKCLYPPRIHRTLLSMGTSSKVTEPLRMPAHVFFGICSRPIIDDSPSTNIGRDRSKVLACSHILVSKNFCEGCLLSHAGSSPRTLPRCCAIASRSNTCAPCALSWSNIFPLAQPVLPAIRWYRNPSMVRKNSKTPALYLLYPPGMSPTLNPTLDNTCARDMDLSPPLQQYTSTLVSFSLS